MNQPPLGYTTNVELIEVIDGDTIKVKIEKELTVRLKDFNAPEIRKPASKEEIAKGIEYKEFLINLLKNKNIVLFVPSDGSDIISHLFSIGSRVVGSIFIEGKNVVEILREKGRNV